MIAESPERGEYVKRLDMSKGLILDQVCSAMTNGELDNIFEKYGETN